MVTLLAFLVLIVLAILSSIFSYYIGLEVGKKYLKKLQKEHKSNQPKGVS